ncbi:hypothetical protein HC231_08315 [Brenneria izadpanahii]|uniref:Lipoprotein n=1 Tax=Brenneria izadpanahii TaxID=2722756 RepID=A0ABX7UMQ6_9GAMM|nr:hypothetical protein [Brenneria izadpanahii]QTF06480.1 hypothetical protein HC231_08315 [Brenneria izadpanahii]
MKFSLFLLMLCALTGCVQHGGLPPLSDEPQPVTDANDNTGRRDRPHESLFLFCLSATHEIER